MRRLALAGLFVLSITACSSATQAGPTPVDRRNTITTEEIEKARTSGWFAWDLISNLRPHFLKSQSAQYLTDRDPVFAVVYVDEMQHGDLETLKSLSVEGIRSIQFIPPYDTTARFGQTLQGGAIVIRTH
jgi:hypothetical protein